LQFKETKLHKLTIINTKHAFKYIVFL